MKKTLISILFILRVLSSFSQKSAEIARLQEIVLEEIVSVDSNFSNRPIYVKGVQGRPLYCLDRNLLKLVPEINPKEFKDSCNIQMPEDWTRELLVTSLQPDKESKEPWYLKLGFYSWLEPNLPVIGRNKWRIRNAVFKYPMKLVSISSPLIIQNIKLYKATILFYGEESGFIIYFRTDQNHHLTGYTISSFIS